MLYVPEDRLPLLHGHDPQHVAHSLEPRLLVASHHLRQLSRELLRLHGLHLFANRLPFLLVPLGDLSVLLLPADDARPALEQVHVPGTRVVGLGRALVPGRRQHAGRHAPEDVLLVETAPQAPVEEAARVAPLEHLPDGAFGLHASGAVVQVGELDGNLGVDGQQLLLSLDQPLLDRGRLLGLQGLVVAEPLLQVGVRRVQARHRLELLLLAVLDADDAVGLEDTTARLGVGVHLHGGGVDGRIDDDPRAAAQLAERRNVDKDGLLKLDQGIDDEGAVLENLVEHVALTAREASPVGQDHQRQLLAVVEVVDGLRRLEGRVGVPHATGLVADLLHRVGVGRVGRRDVLDRARLDGNDAHGDAAQAGTAYHDGLRPAAERLDKRVLVEETALEATVVVVLAGNHPPHVEGLLLRRVVRDIAVPAVGARADGDGAVALLGHKRHPLDDSRHALEIVVGRHVRHAIAVHDLRATELQVGRVDLAAQQVVQGGSTGQDDGLALDLHGTLAEADKVGTDTCCHHVSSYAPPTHVNRYRSRPLTDGSAGDQGHREDVVVRPARRTGNEARAPQALDAETVLASDNSDNLVAPLAVLGNLLGDDVVLEALLGLLVQIQVSEAAVLLGRVVPGDLEVRHQLLGQAQAGAGVGREVDAGDAQLASQLGALVEEVVLLGAKGTNLVGNVVGDDDEAAARGVLGGAGLEDPADHAARVGARLAVDLVEVVLAVEDELRKGHALTHLGLLRRQGGLAPDRLDPGVLGRLAEQLGEVVHVLCAHEVGLVPLGLEGVLGGVRGRDGHEMHGALFLGAADAVEDPVALFRLVLRVHVDVDDVSRRVGDDDAERVGGARLGLRADDADLDLGHAQPPASGTEAVEEALEAVLDLLGVQLEDGREVHEDVVQIRGVAADNLERVKDVVDDAVGLGDEVLGGRDLVAEAARPDHSTGEVALVGVDGLADGLVDVDVFVLRKDGLDVELGQTPKLQLEGQGRLAVTDAVVLLVLGRTEGVVPGASHAAGEQLALELLDDGQDASHDLLVIAALGIPHRHVDDGGQLVFLLGLLLDRAQRLSPAVEVREDVGAVVLLLMLAVEGNRLQRLREELLGLVNVLAGDDDALARRLLFPLAGEARHVADGRQAKLGLANLAQLEVPGHKLGVIPLVIVVLDLLDDVGTVRAADVDLERRQAHPGVVVGEEERDDVEDGVLGVDHLLDDLEAGLAVVPSALAVPRLNHRRAQNVLHLGSALLHRGQRALDHNLAGLERDLGGDARRELRQPAERLAQELADVADVGLVGAVLFEDGEHERALGADAAVRENRLDNLVDAVLVLVTQLEDDAVILGLAQEELLHLPVCVQQALDEVQLPHLLAVGVDVEDLGERGERRLEQGRVAVGDALLDELVKGLLQGLGRELDVSRLGPLDDLGEQGIELRGHPGMQRRELRVPLAVGELGAPQHLDELPQGRRHDDGVVEAHEDVHDDVAQDGEALDGLVADHDGVAVRRELVDKGLGLLDAARVVEGEDAQDVTGLERGAGLLDELHDAVLLGNQGHVHLHDLDLGKGLAGLDVRAVLDRVLDELAGAGTPQLGRVAFLLQQARLAVNGQARRANLLLPVDVVAVAVEQDEETTIAECADADGALGAVDEEVVAVVARTGGGELVAVALVDEVDVEDGLENLLGRDLALFQTGAVLGHARLAGNVRLGGGAADDGEHGVGALGGEPVGDELVEPAGRDGVVLEGFRLQQLDEVLDRRPEVTADAQLLEGDDHVLPRHLSVLTVGEDVAKLAVREAVDAALGADGEVAPDVGAAPEVELVHDTVGRLEALAGVLGGDSAGRGVAGGCGSALGLGGGLELELEINLARGPGVDAVQQPDVTNPVQGQTHGDLKLGGGQVNAADHLSRGVLDLETRVELEEVELVVGVRVQVLDGAGGDVADELAEADGGVLHGLEGVGLGDGDGGLLDDLLVPPLDGAVAAEEGDVVAVLVGQQLDLEMPGVAGQLHDEDGGAGDLAGGGLVQGLEVVGADGLADALAATALGGLDHDGEANLLGLFQAILPRGDAALGVHVVRDGDDAVIVDLDAVDARPRPGDAGDGGVLCDDGGRDFVAERPHGGAGGANEDDLVGGGGQRLWQLGVLGGVAPRGRQYSSVGGTRGTAVVALPARPNCVDVHTLGNVDNQLDVGVVVVVGAARDLDVVVGHADVVGVGPQVLGGGHDGEVDGALIAERFVGPFPHGADLLDGGDAVVGDEDLLLSALPACPWPRDDRPVPTFVMTVWPSCWATKSLTLLAGALASLLPPMKWSAILCFSAYDALPLTGTVRPPAPLDIASGMIAVSGAREDARRRRMGGSGGIEARGGRPRRHER
ncbi:Uncharacterized protein TCAP_02317 [Tolypocladium capitatum]|uniref:Uncharacterized protein n=1 Tax=Tolypocladium capitatum TaxID=45235 RepID=A0A2K3QJQ5_9HYPO|nr:Uncharacterized protein TCAP_02317 [Tolypocladium capitatum]